MMRCVMTAVKSEMQSTTGALPKGGGITAHQEKMLITKAISVKTILPVTNMEVITTGVSWRKEAGISVHEWSQKQ